MIDTTISNVIEDFNQRSADALGYNTPGYQPKFHDILDARTRSIKVFDPLSAVAPQNTYFVVDNGDGSHSYSRGGDFRVSQGQLVTRDGRAVLGYPNGVEKGTLAPITVPAGTPDGGVRIASDGTISYAGAEAGAPLAAPSVTPPLSLAPPVTDAHASENLPPPTSANVGANAKNYDVPDIALDSDPNVPMVALPQDAGHLNPRALVSKSADAAIDASMNKEPATDDGGPVSLVGAALKRHARIAQDSAAVTAPTTAFDASMTGRVRSGLKAGMTQPIVIGTPVGKVALARFAAGTIVSNDGTSTSGPPLEMGPPGNGQIALLKTGYRDVGNVNHLTSMLKVTSASETLNAVLQTETAKQNNAKKVMDLIK